VTNLARARGIEALARRTSTAGDIAYLEADMFGGTGTHHGHADKVSLHSWPSSRLAR